MRETIQYKDIGRIAKEINMEDAETIGEIAANLGGYLKSNPGICFTMGDLWPASIVMLPLHESKESDKPHKMTEIDWTFRVIDWEFSHYGSPIQDIAHLGAHIWMLEQTAKDSLEASCKLLLYTLKNHSLSKYRLRNSLCFDILNYISLLNVVHIYFIL